MSLQQIGVIGAGQMGAGIAQVAAQAGLAVVMHDIAPEMCKRGVDSIARNLDRMIERGRFKPEERDRVMRRVETTTNLEDLAKVAVRDRGGGRERRREDRAAAEARQGLSAGDDFRLEHLVDFDHAGWARGRRAPIASSGCIS